MKLILAAILILTLVSPPALSVQANSNHAGDPVNPVYTNERQTDQENVLIFLDNLPWGSSVLQTLLDSLGVTYTEAASSEMATIDMDPFDVIILASQQPTGFYREFQAQLTRFEDYLLSGGVLEFHCATLEMSFWEPLTLPGGVTHEREEDHYNFKVNESHPILAGLPDTLHGSFASHEHFWNLPPGTDVITIDEVDLPTTVEYSFGAGTVLATGMAWEFNYNFGYTSGGCLPNAVAYTLSISGASAVAAYDPEEDMYRSVCKVGSGFTDENLAEMPDRLDEYRLEHKPVNVYTLMEPNVWFDPVVVMEVLGDEITLSPNHTAAFNQLREGSGLAIRFPRFTRWRDDKSADEATQVSEIVDMYNAQLKTVQ